MFKVLVRIVSLRKAVLLGLACFGLVALARDGVATPRTGSLTIHLTDLRNSNGRVAVALFDSEENFPDQKRALSGKLARIDGSTASARFSGLKAGTYAVAVLHDENANDKMDFNLVGMPLEGFGFSNDATVWFGPPSFGAAAFRLRDSGGQIRIKVRYFEL